MSAVNRGVVYSLLTVVLVLLMGIAGLLAVAYYRHQRLADETTDLRRNLTQQQGQIKNLQERLQDCDTNSSEAPVDTSWGYVPKADSLDVLRQVSWTMQ